MTEEAAASNELAGSAGSEHRLRIVKSPYPGRQSRLCADFVAGPGSIGAFFGPAFRDTAALAELAERLNRRPYPRASLTTALGRFAREVQAPPCVKARISRLADASAVTVFAGQQAGLFTGPLHTVYKALTVERWATDLDRRLGIPVVPCFWLADDDHDFAEVDHIELPGNGDLHRIAYVPAVKPEGRPIGDLIIDAGIDSAFAELQEALPKCRHTAAVLQDLRECYAVGTGFGRAFARLWYRLFPESRLVFVPASDEQLKHLSGPLLARAAVEHAQLFELYEHDSVQLVALGYHRQVRKRREQSFLFRQRGRRSGIIRDATGLYRVPGHGAVTEKQLFELVSQRPEDYSGNVLLRPLVQNSLFPVLGVVLGPAETAYHAQIAGLHDYLGVPRPAVLPRTSATIVEARAAHALKGLGVDLQALARNAEGEIARVLGSGFPDELDAGFRATADRIESALRDLGGELERRDSDMQQALRACSRRTRRELDRAERKARAIHRQRQRDTAARLEWLAVQLFPSGELQERRFNIVRYWARYGPEFMSELHRQWPASESDHLLLMPE